MYNEKFMKLALKEAEKAYVNGEIPIGAVIVNNGNVISKAYNQKEKRNSSMYHAELLAIQKANRKINNWRLDGCDLYVTLEPCPMCASLIHQSRIDNVFYCLKKEEQQNYNIISSIFVDNYSNKITNFKFVDCGKKSYELINNFFNKRR